MSSLKNIVILLGSITSLSLYATQLDYKERRLNLINERDRLSDDVDILKNKTDNLLKNNEKLLNENNLLKNNTNKELLNYISILKKDNNRLKRRSRYYHASLYNEGTTKLIRKYGRRAVLGKHY